MNDIHPMDILDSLLADTLQTKDFNWGLSDSGNEVIAHCQEDSFIYKIIEDSGKVVGIQYKSSTL